MYTRGLDSKQAKFVRDLASEVERNTRPLHIEAAEVLNPGDVEELTLDDALQRAEGLWMSGYTWDEIEAKLVDMEFSEDIAQKAVKKTVEYAKEKLNNGPFSTPLIEGQLVLLKNGKVATLRAISPQNCSVEWEGEAYTVKPNQIDHKASLQLKEAYLMRSMARRMVLDAQKKYTEPEIEEGLALPEPPGGPETKAVPPIEEKYDVKFQQKAPEGLTELTPESGEAQKLPAQLELILNNIEGLEEMKNEVHAETQRIRKEQLEPLQQQFKELTSDEQTNAKNAFLVSNQILQAVDGMDTIIFGDYKNQVVALRTKVVEQENQPGVVDELNALKEILTKNHPKIAKDVLEALKTYMQANAVIERRVEKTLYKYPYRKHPLKKKESLGAEAQVLEKVKKFFKMVVDKVKSVTNRLFDEALPLAEETIEELRSFNKKAAAARARVRVSAAIETLSGRNKWNR